MESDGSSIQVLWKRRGTFVLAAAGSAIGLGNIWRFPYELGQNGGGAFLLVYLACIALICVPVMVAEALIGRVGRSGPVQSYIDIAYRQGYGHFWVLVGMMGVLTGVMISGFYSVVGGWTTAYLVDAFTFQEVSNELSSEALWAKVQAPGQSIMMMTVFLLISGGIVFMGVIAGLERFLRLIMPVLLSLFVVIILYSLAVGSTAEALAYIFVPDFSRLNAEVALKAMGHAFFSLSLGMGVLVTFGSYTPSEQNLGASILTVALLDTLIAVLAGAMIFPIVFAVGLEPDAGPSLVFKVLPYVFAQMLGGGVMKLAFFLLLMLAAISSMISLIEPIVSTVEHRYGLGRHRASLAVIGTLWLLGVGCVVSGSLFGLLDFLTANVLLPLGGVLVALYVGWKLSPKLYEDQAGMPAGKLYKAWILIIRWVAPLVIFAILINGLYSAIAG